MSAVPSVFHLANKQPRKVVNRTVQGIEPDLLKIEHDCPLHVARVRASKYDEIFSKLKPGSALVCEPKEAGRIAQTLRKWLQARNMPYTITQSAHCPDGRGRVWMIAK